MPLLPGKENVGHNIKAEQNVGKPHKQAVAIALNVAGESRPNRMGRPGVKTDTKLKQVLRGKLKK